MVDSGCSHVAPYTETSFNFKLVASNIFFISHSEWFVYLQKLYEWVELEQNMGNMLKDYREELQKWITHSTTSHEIKD